AAAGGRRRRDPGRAGAWAGPGVSMFWQWAPQVLMVVWHAFAFVLGACAGSFVNVCVARIPMEKSVFWPGSRCGSCFQPILLRDTIPLFSYLRLRGRCRHCGQRFSARYFVVELLTALGFLGIFHLEVIRNIHGFAALEWQQFRIVAGVVPPEGWVVF